MLMIGTVDPGYPGLTIWRSLVPIRPQGVINFRLMLGDGCFLGSCPWATDTPMPLEESAGHDHMTRFKVALNAFGSDLLASAGKSRSVLPRSR